MENLPLISVIVPVYKVEAYLDKCISSIVGQTYRNLEIILVDDGSPDNCGAICDAWAEWDSRIKVIHKENGGLSDARNAGMSAATGELMGFVDSDDHIAPGMYQLLYERMIADNSDISACGVEMVFENGSPSRPLTKPGTCILDRTAAMEAVIRESWLKQPVWYKLYKSELVRDILFPVGKCHEDVYWTWQAVARAQKVSVFDAPCYFYVQRSGSIMGEGYSMKRLDSLEAKQQRLEYLKIHYAALENAGRIELLFSCVYAMQMSLRHLSKQKLKTAKKIIVSTWHQSKGNAGMSFKQRIWYSLASISFEGTCRLRNLLEIGL